MLRHLALGLGAALSHWEGSRLPDELIVSPSDRMDVQLWARPRVVLGALELSLPLSIGPSLMEQLVIEEARPPELGWCASAQIAALYWLSSGAGVLLELGGEYHHASAREHDGTPLTLDLLQARIGAGAALAF